MTVSSWHETCSLEEIRIRRRRLREAYFRTCPRSLKRLGATAEHMNPGPGRVIPALCTRAAMPAQTERLLSASVPCRPSRRTSFAPRGPQPCSLGLGVGAREAQLAGVN